MKGSGMMNSHYEFHNAVSLPPKSNDKIEKNLFQKPSMMPNDYSLAIDYVPFQQWEQPYAFPVALTRGTIFPSLDKPFIAREAIPHG